MARANSKHRIVQCASRASPKFAGRSASSTIAPALRRTAIAFAMTLRAEFLRLWPMRRWTQADAGRRGRGRCLQGIRTQDGICDEGDVGNRSRKDAKIVE